MAKKWFQVEETSAGIKRLIVSYYLFKFFGSFPLRVIAFFVTLFAFLKAKEQKQASLEFFLALQSFTGQKYSPISSFKQFLNYGNSLADKIISFSGKIEPKKFAFENKEDEKKILDTIKNGKGIFFISAHIGNIEILRSLLNSSEIAKPKGVNIFMDIENCKIFNSFLNKIQIKNKTKILATEEIGLETGIWLTEKILNGEIIFITGDRISRTNPVKSFKANFLNRKISLPEGVFRLALALEAPVYFVVCVKEKGKYKILTEQFKAKNLSRKEKLDKIKEKYSSFLERTAVNYPYQFYNFFRFFDD